MHFNLAALELPEGFHLYPWVIGSTDFQRHGEVSVYDYKEKKFLTGDKEGYGIVFCDISRGYYVLKGKLTTNHLEPLVLVNNQNLVMITKSPELFEALKVNDNCKVTCY